MKKIFFIGDEWLFYKVYCGYKSADTVLVEAVKSVTEKLFSEKVIDNWFFIRYSDTDLHLRIRYHYTDKANAGKIINALNSALIGYVESGIVSKVMTDVYERELNRYGENTIEITEKIFGIDSAMILNFISFLSGKGDVSEHIRWRFGLKAVDRLLSDFGMSMPEKTDTIVRFRDNFNAEFGVEKFLKKQLNDNYREVRKDIEELMMPDSAYEHSQVFNSLLDFKTNMTSAMISDLSDPKNPNYLKIDKAAYISSLSHMMLNRLFRSNQRTQEMVLYNYLWKYYDSVQARGKNKESEKVKELTEV